MLQMRNSGGLFNMHIGWRWGRREALAAVLVGLGGMANGFNPGGGAWAASLNPAGAAVVRGPSSPPTSMSRPGWKVVQAATDEQGHSAVAITRIADTQNSDPEMVGLMIRCSPPAQVDVALVVVTPFAPKSRPSVSIDSPGSTRSYEGRVAPGGTAVILPGVVAGLAAGHWQGLERLSFRIDNSGHQISGQVELAGLSQAYAEMTAKCMQ
ncbi:hypothetical protein [Rhodopseudomonas sp.]|uniref:hypothetical protein n=1 Tax=Rhodopseudomonas sp. TaxID=1078 RepID=UPI003B3B2647